MKEVLLKYSYKKSRFILSIMLMVVSFFIQISPALAAAGTFSLSPASGNFNKGCSFSVDIIMNTGGANSDGADAYVMYDATRFTVLSITNGKLFPDYPSSTFDASTGKVSISGVASPGQSYTGSGIFATLNMKVTDTAPTGAATLKFDFDPANKTKTTDSNISSIEGGQIVDNLNSVTDGSFTIGTGVCGASSSGGSTPSGGGTPSVSTPSATTLPTKIPYKELPAAGDNSSLWIMGTVGGLLTILGLIGLALL